MIAATLMIAAQLQLATVPSATVGVADGDTLQTLFNVARVYENDQGHVFVIQSGTPYVAVFDSMGVRVGTLGRDGGGPGEFAVPITVSFVADSIWIADDGHGKFSLFSPTHDHVRDIVVGERFPQLRAIGATRPSEVLPDGSLAVFSVDSVSTTYVVQPNGGFARVFSARTSDYLAKVQIGGRTSNITKPLTDYAFAIVLNGEFFSIDRSQQGGVRLQPLQRPANPIVAELPGFHVSIEDVNASIAGFVQHAKSVTPSISTDRIRDAFRAAIDAPDYSYYIRGVVNSRDGFLWLRQDPPGAESTTLFQVDPATGEVVATVRVPSENRVLSIRAGAAWVLERDADGVPFLQRRRFVHENSGVQ